MASRWTLCDSEFANVSTNVFKPVDVASCDQEMKSRKETPLRSHILELEREQA